MGQNERAPCRRCLLAAFGAAEEAAAVRAYIRSFDAEARADWRLYRRRLAACRRCNFLQNGLCRLCGCFVRARAAKNVLHCAASPPKW